MTECVQNALPSSSSGNGFTRMLRKQLLAAGHHHTWGRDDYACLEKLVRIIALKFAHIACSQCPVVAAAMTHGCTEHMWGAFRRAIKTLFLLWRVMCAVPDEIGRFSMFYDMRRRR